MRHTVDWSNKSTIVRGVTARIDFIVNNDFILNIKVMCAHYTQMNQIMVPYQYNVVKLDDGLFSRLVHGDI